MDMQKRTFALTVEAYNTTELGDKWEFRLILNDTITVRDPVWRVVKTGDSFDAHAAGALSQILRQ